ncbi:ABC transporter [Agrobacterium sp. TS43]|uniref:carbohydrate ABC transporter permease n=1 Tax=Agrobacterium TaxID=357 RepID=UPI000375AF9E|nr:MULTISPECIES: sugar ABC transporter permease [Agrobacterium]EPR10943.1 ABC transporter [Agrobacterium radiobacter DSM 30147]KDR86788.1 ABC transporter [Agrobacterium tumefaciens GW4]KVK45700.1 ABC transporter [Agrobacterium sp. LY4]KVK45789.1 ABC transporter [Agrobacterium sp. JL28]KVK59404.1 ABC transporter [Agrobacterium sp. TS45]
MSIRETSGSSNAAPLGDRADGAEAMVAAATGRIFKKRRQTSTGGRFDRHDTRSAIWLMAPALALYAVFSLAPIAATFWLSFNSSAGFNTASSFVGLDNYAATAADPIVWLSLWHTLLWLIYHVVLAGGLGLVLALAISRLKVTQVFFRTAFFLPHLVSLAVVGVIWANIYDPFYGLLNTALVEMGLGAFTKGWLSDPALVLFSVNVASSWQGFGLYMLLFIAGLQNIDRSLYDAAEVDGASAFQKLVHVTLPGLREVTTFVVSLAMINGLKGFATVFVMTNGGPFYQSELITTYIYRLAFQSQDHGRAAVLCILLSLLAIVITLVFNRWRARLSQ